MLKRFLSRLTGRAKHATAARAGAFWDVEARQPVASYWTSYPSVRAYVNRLLTGHDWLWPFASFKIFHAYEPRETGLSIGCGTGEFERAVWNLRVCREVTGFDVSRESIRTAKRLAVEKRMDGLHYEIRNCDRLNLPPQKYDFVFCHQSLHHIGDPDRLLREIAKSLKPDGLLYVDDYVGPNRDQWGEEHLSEVRQEWESIDPSLRLGNVTAPFDYRDPSEMIRSDRIRPAIEANFDVISYRPYWGNLLYPLFVFLDGNKLNLPENASLLHRLVEREAELVDSGVFRDPLFAVYIARPKGVYST